MNIIQLIYKQTGKQIGNVRINFVVKGVGIFNNPKGALKASKQTLRPISVVLVGRLYNSTFSKKQEYTFIEIKRYSFVKRNEFVRDFGLRKKDKSAFTKVSARRGR
jgi:hypothetical protein